MEGENRNIFHLIGWEQVKIMRRQVRGERKTDRGEVLYVNHKHKLIQPHHSHSLPVLLMFLKLPKLFNFHILRLAAEHEISTGRGNRGQAQVFRKRLLRNIQRKTNTSAPCYRGDIGGIHSSYLAEQMLLLFYQCAHILIHSFWPLDSFLHSSIVYFHILRF